MRNSDPESGWNPRLPVKVTPEEYEQQVLRWIRGVSAELQDFNARHLGRLRGHGGEYEFDIVVEFTIVAGAKIVLLVECKHHGRPLEREHILTFHAKLKDVSAHKGMMFSTSGFQKGALEYASAKGIATVTFIDGRETYETRDRRSSRQPPGWVQLPRFVGVFVGITRSTVRCSAVDENRVEAVLEWLKPMSGSESE